MGTELLVVLSVILLVLGLLGTFLPVLPGLLFSFAGLLLYKYGTQATLSEGYIWLFAVLTLVSIFLNYIIPAKTTQKYGGSRWGSMGSFIGTILGLILIPLPIGFLIGMLLGVFIAEVIHDHQNISKALQATKGAFIGFLLGTGFNFCVALSMLAIVTYHIFFK